MSKTAKPAVKKTMIRPKFYMARRDTRWDPYPQQEPEEVVAHDYYGFWKKAGNGEWFQSPVSYHLLQEISAEEANASPLAMIPSQWV